MSPLNPVKSGSAPPAGAPPGPAGKPAATPSGPAAAGKDGGSGTRAPTTTGRVVHDERGNAVWDWLKQAGRSAIESTSHLLKKLEVPELKVEDKKDDELRLMDVDPGGGYDPYGKGSAKTTPPKRK
jgi:hypothetical protein